MNMKKEHPEPGKHAGGRNHRQPVPGNDGLFPSLRLERHQHATPTVRPCLPHGTIFFSSGRRSLLRTDGYPAFAGQWQQTGGVHRRSQSSGYCKKRKHGYLEALRNNRIPIEKELVICRKLDFEEGKIATETLLALPNPPDAILAMNDTLAFAAMEVIKSHGLRIPEDIAIIGYTDEQHANYVEPKLSAISHQTYKMGESACQLLIEQIKGEKTVKQVVVPTHLQIRESSIKTTYSSKRPSL